MVLIHAQSNLINLKPGESELQALNFPLFHFGRFTLCVFLRTLNLFVRPLELFPDGHEKFKVFCVTILHQLYQTH